MRRRTIFQYILFLVLLCIFFCGCSKKGNNVDRSGPPRDNTPKTLTPSADGTAVFGNEFVSIDASHANEGYVMVRYTGTNSKVKLQILSPTQTEYTYLLSPSGQYETFPLSCGNGVYSLKVLENVGGDSYVICFAQDIESSIDDEFRPFLYPNQYVNFTSESAAVSKGSELAADTYSDLEVVEKVYTYVIENVTYDEAKAQSVTYGYLPNVDETLASGTGICFDYAALMSCMLRSQGIPTKLEVGYAGDALHSWISIYIDEIGWVNNIIEFDGTSWQLMDPTLAANNDSSSVKKYIGDGTNYLLKYSY